MASPIMYRRFVPRWHPGLPPKKTRTYELADDESVTIPMEGRPFVVKFTRHALVGRIFLSSQPVDIQEPGQFYFRFSIDADRVLFRDEGWPYLTVAAEKAVNFSVIS